MTVEQMKATPQGGWTHFHDMHSGGGLKTEWAHIFVEAPLAEAKRIFEERTGRDPDNETCGCCGDDYSISEEPTLEQASGYERNCAYDSEAKAWAERQDTTSVWRSSQPYVPVDEFVKRPDVLVIRRTTLLPSVAGKGGA
jgi:hypothetical protein